MTDPFINLKRSLKKTVFKDLSFSCERKHAVREKIRGKQSHLHFHTWEEETLVAVLESVQQDEKIGYDISTFLFQKNINSFKNNEGQLYTLLHFFENKGILQSNWKDEKKYYSLTRKGKKLLVGARKQEHAKVERGTLKQLLEEASL
ncbi:PadR family transcriptional regulator [Evansella sp. AB-rgal1]|uniref:PadR family transcriptional regulator n=1 Tax=Evansella sp. AB-rgal1 TaxID=3242696 RepID=UPI00359D1ACD